jgi:hypothetical protein
VWADNNAVGKRNFLEYYRKARLIGLTESNIRAGWKGSGLWPINMTKPLMNRLLAKPTQDSVTFLPTSQLVPGMVIPGPNTTKEVVGPLDPELWVTPGRSLDLRRQLVDFNLQTEPSRTRRRLFDKVNKAFDKMDTNIALLKTENEALRAQLEAVKPKKRKRVDTNPNSLFVDTAAIYRAQVAAGAVEAGPVDSSEDGDSNDGNSCIVVATDSRK